MVSTNRVHRIIHILAAPTLQKSIGPQLTATEDVLKSIVPPREKALGLEGGNAGIILRFSLSCHPLQLDI
jgi:hypothetical protein